MQFEEAECYKIDPVKGKVHCRTTGTSNLGGKEEFAVDYDILIVAMGAQANTFNTPGVVENAHFLKVRNTLSVTLLIWEMYNKCPFD